jgi:hypothetical protein
MAADLQTAIEAAAADLLPTMARQQASAGSKEPPEPPCSATKTDDNWCPAVG